MVKHISTQQICRYHEIDWNTYRPKRAGVIPVVKHNGISTYNHNNLQEKNILKDKKYVILGRDAQYGELTDFGGGVSYKKRKENALQGAFRELDEESLGSFGNFNLQDANFLRRLRFIKSEKILIIWMPIVGDIHKIYKRFQQEKDNQESLEVNDLVIISLENIRSILLFNPKEDNKIYSKVYNLLSKNRGIATYCNNVPYTPL